MTTRSKNHTSSVSMAMQCRTTASIENKDGGSDDTENTNQIVKLSDKEFNRTGEFQCLECDNSKAEQFKFWGFCFGGWGMKMQPLNSRIYIQHFHKADSRNSQDKFQALRLGKRRSMQPHISWVLHGRLGMQILLLEGRSKKQCNTTGIK